MRLKLFYLLAIFTLIIPFSAATILPVDDLNSQMEENPIVLKSYMGFVITDGNIALSVSRTDGSVENYYLSIEENIMKKIYTGVPEKSTYDISTDEATINTIITSQDTAGETLKFYKEKKIVVKANGLINNLKLTLIKFFLRI